MYGRTARHLRDSLLPRMHTSSNSAHGRSAIATDVIRSNGAAWPVRERLSPYPREYRLGVAAATRLAYASDRGSVPTHASTANAARSYIAASPSGQQAPLAGTVEEVDPREIDHDVDRITNADRRPLAEATDVR